MGLADQLTVACIAAAPVIVLLYVVDFAGHDYWFDGRVARRSGRTSAT
jgi:phosphatidylglycerophosphate synthase